jgi:hypothetical protein
MKLYQKDFSSWCGECNRMKKERQRSTCAATRLVSLYLIWISQPCIFSPCSRKWCYKFFFLSFIYFVISIGVSSYQVILYFTLLEEFICINWVLYWVLSDTNVVNCGAIVRNRGFAERWRVPCYPFGRWAAFTSVMVAVASRCPMASKIVSSLPHLGLRVHKRNPSNAHHFYFLLSC